MGFICWIGCLFADPYLESWIASASMTRTSFNSQGLYAGRRIANLIVPLISIPVTLACVHYHPAPVDPCPCFEDAIAVLSVMLGGVLGAWEEQSNGRGFPPAVLFNIWSQGPVVGVLICLERVILGKSQASTS
jgi:hypothetical protein